MYLLSPLELLLSLPVALFLHPVVILFSLVASLFAPLPFPLKIYLILKDITVVLHKICLPVAL